MTVLPSGAYWGWITSETINPDQDMSWTKPGYLPAASGWLYGKAPFGSGKILIFEIQNFASEI